MASTSAGRIRGLTVEIGGDTTKLDKALKSTNNEIKNTQTALKDVEKLLKLDPTNIELLKQKQKLLNNEVDECNTKLKKLYEAEANLKNAGIDENSEQFMGLRREIIDTEEQLKNCEEESENFSAGLSAVGAVFDEISEKASLVAEKTKALSTAAAGVVTGIGTMAYKAMTAADDLNTLAQQSGFTTAELQKFEYASDVVDVSSDTIISALKKMRKNMDSTSTDTEEAWRKLNVQTTNVNGELRDSTDVFYEVLNALSQVTNETERDTLAMQIFGKNADELAGIIDDGGQKLREYGQAAEDAGLIWTQESIDAANAINDIVDVLKADISQTILITGAKALEALAPVIEYVAELISKVLDWIGSLDSETLKTILIIGTIIALISPVASLISGISSAVSTLITLLPTLLAAAPWVTIIALVAQLAYEIYSWVENWDMMSQYFQQGIDKIKSALQSLATFIKSLFEPITTLIDGIVDKVEGLIDKIKDLLNMGSSSSSSSSTTKIWTGGIIGLANGGTVSSGSVMVGEAGPEILSVASGKATVTPLNNTTHNTYNQLSTNPIQVSLNLDKMTLARQLISPMNYLNNLKGSSNVK